MAQRQPTTTPSSTSQPPAAGYPWFITGVGSWFAAFGMQGVLFAWLVVGELELEARWVGITQSANMIPAVFLVLFGGVLADRRDRRNLLISLHLLAVVTTAALALAVAAGQLSLGLLIGYALVMGSVSAFVMPARDSLLSEVTRGGDMVRAVTGLNLAQFGLQGVGSLLGGAARWIGTVPALGLPPVFLLVGALAYARLAPAPPEPGRAVPRMRLADFAVGARIVWGSPVLFPIFGLTFAVGVLFGGPFMVVFPLLVRDFYGGDVAEIAVISMTFPLGTIASSVLVLVFGLKRRGLAMLVSLVAGSAALAVVGLGLPFSVALVGVFFWGVAGAVFMNAGRAVFQEEAPVEQRARVLSTYTLGFMGSGGLVGAPLSGFVVDLMGPTDALLVAGAAMTIFVALLAATTRLAQIR